VQAGQRYISPMVADAVNADAPAGKGDRRPAFDARAKCCSCSPRTHRHEIAQRLSLR
jgi:hypothetical protein